MRDSMWLSLLHSLVCLLWSALTVLVLWYAGKRVRAAWPKLSALFGPEGIRGIAFLCAAVPFLSLLATAVQALIRLAYASTLAVPLSVLSHPLEAPAEEITVFQLVAHTVEMLHGALVHELAPLADTFTPADLLVFLLVWMAAGHVLAFFLVSEDAHQSQGAKSFARLLKGISLKRWSLAVFLLSGLALCIASITTVSELKEPTDPATAPSAELLEKKFKAGSLTLPESYPVDVEADTDPIVQLRTQLQAQRANPALAADAAHAARLDAVEVRLVLLESSRRQLLGSWTHHVSTSLGYYERITQDARAEFEVTNMSGFGARERRQHFLSILAWHDAARRELYLPFNRCRDTIVNAEHSWAEWAANLQYALNQPSQPLQGAEDTAKLLRRELKGALEACQIDSLPPVPKRADLGSSLGPLKPLAGWLLGTESLQLALIIGMLGAGLLGSTVAAFFRSQGEPGNEVTWEQLVGIVVRSVTAAIVVFLAVQGGLSTMATSSEPGGPQPNPYVLLLICFVAAVYSEQIWNAARARLTQQLGSAGQPLSPAPAMLAEKQS